MYRVGLTGGIGSGKTTVANLFKNKGIPVIDTDEIAHQISAPDGPAYPAIVEQFGQQILNSDNTINRKKLAQIIFSSKVQKQLLENILHPIIWLLVEQQVQSIEAPYCIIVVPLLFEGNHRQRFDTVLVVDSTEDSQISRVIERDKRSTEDIKLIISQQISRQQRLEQADHIIVNNGDLDSLDSAIMTLHETFLDASSSA